MSVVLASNGAMLQRNQFTLRGEATTQPSAPGNCLFKQADYISVIQVTDTYTYNGGANEICGMPVSNSNGHTVNGWQHANPEQTAQYYNSIRTSDTGSYGGSFEDALSGYVGHAASTQWTWKNNNSSSNAGSINNSAESDQPYNVADSQQNNVLYLDGTGNVGIGTGFNDTTVNGCNILSATRTTNNINTLTLNCTLSANLSGPFLVKGIGQDQFFNTPQGQTTSATVPGTCSSSLPNCAGSNQISYSSVYAPNVSLAQPSSGGVYAGNYGSGVSATGYAGQYCVLTNFNGVTGASAELFLSGTNSINTGSAIIVTAPGSGATAGPSTATAGNGTASCSGTASMFAVLGPTCNCLGEVVPVYFPGATADVSGTFRLGGWTSSGTFPGTKAYAGTVYTQFATFLTGSITPTAVAASSGCSDQNFAANGTVTSNFGTTNSTTPSIYDAELTIVPPSTLGSGTASPGKVTVTGDVSIHFCVAGSASSWTPPAGVYTVVAIH
jgi:hypothetical protein